MPVYKYKAINNTGSQVQGIVDAESVKAATEKLKREGIYLSSIKESSASKLPLIKMPFRGVSASELAVTTRQFSALISAGLPLESSLIALSEQAEDQKLKEVLAQVRDKVSEGSSLYKALSEHKDVFSDLYVNIVKAGEASGALDVVLYRLADFLEKQAELRSKVRGAMIYPAIMFIVGMGVLFFMMAFVIPKIAKIFEASNKALPFITVALIETSNFIRSNFVFLTIFFAIVAFLVIRYTRTDKGRRVYDKIRLRLPVFGKISSMVAVSRFTRTLSTLLSSGIPLLEAIEIGEAVIDNTVYSDNLGDVRISVREGSSFARPLRQGGIFPPLVTRMVAVGEQTGELEGMLSKIADMYDLQVDTTLSALTSLLEPIMILFMGGVMGFIVFAILLPIFELTSTIG